MAGRARRDSTARARELGGELKGAREQVRLKVAELAEILGWSPTKLSRVESGSPGVSEVDAARYLASCRVPRGEVNRLLDLARETDDGYRLRPHGRRLPDELRSLVFQETTAKEITLYEPQLIPGLLQTEEYAREAFRWAGLIPEEGVEVRVQARRARQELLRRPQPPRFAFFVHEEALRSMVGEPRTGRRCAQW